MERIVFDFHILVLDRDLFDIRFQRQLRVECVFISQNQVNYDHEPTLQAPAYNYTFEFLNHNLHQYIHFEFVSLQVGADNKCFF